MKNESKQNNFDWDEFRKSINKSLLKKPEVLAGIALFAVVLSYLVLSPSESTDPAILTENKSIEQLATLPIPEVINENTSNQAILVEEEIPVNNEIEMAETATGEEEASVSEEKTPAFEAHDRLSKTPSIAKEMDEPLPTELVQKEEIIEKTATAITPKKSTDITPPKVAKVDKRKAVDSWVFAKNPELYTIQLIGSSNKKEIESFIKSNQKESNLSYFHTINKNKNWYVVVQGSYNNFSEAENKRKSLPANLAKYGAWTRKYSSIQKEVSANAEKIILMSSSFATNE